VIDALGKTYNPGETIVAEGDQGNCMFVIQEGEADVFRNESGVETLVDTMGAGDIFGEMAILERTVRSSTVRARTQVRALTIDRRTFMRRIQEDPSLAMSVLDVMCRRVRRLDTQVAHLKSDLAAMQGET
jgi:CRP/FNR family cyclic AMP-dependent transcriptional regulator